MPQNVEEEAAAIHLGQDASALRAILRPGCGAALWQRDIPGGVQIWLDGLGPEVLPRGRVIVPPHAVAGTVADLCDASGLPCGAARAWLEADMACLARSFAALTSAPFLRVRLDVVRTNACRKFHVDAITARLLCTYRGTATQYGISTGAGDPAHVFTAPTGAPMVLRGTLWPAQPPSGLLHRSPPIEGTGEVRLVLVIDPVFDPEEDL